MEAVLDYNMEEMRTVDEIKALPQGQRAELIDGVWYDMAAPSRNHQRLLVGISNRIQNHITEHGGKGKAAHSHDL